MPETKPETKPDAEQVEPASKQDPSGSTKPLRADISQELEDRLLRAIGLSRDAGYEGLRNRAKFTRFAVEKLIEEIEKRTAASHPPTGPPTPAADSKPTK